jgi:hypothetical protein
MRKSIKKVEKPVFFDLLMKFNQNCKVVFVRDSDNNYIDMDNVYYVENGASDDEVDSDEDEDSDYDDDEDSDLMEDSDDGNSLNDDDIQMLD